MALRRENLLLSASLLPLLILGGGEAQAAAPTYQFNIPAEPLGQALTDFSQASSQQIIYSEDLVRGRKAVGLHGAYSAQQALDVLLAGTGLRAETNSAGVLMVRSKNVQAASNEAAPSTVNVETVVVVAPQIFSGQNLNTDIARSRDDTQPYVIFDRGTIQRSGAQNIDDLLKQRLPMNTTSIGLNQTLSGNGPASNINLRGLGANQTLILVDGHRVESGGVAGIPQQPDLNGIPLSAIDRIEILPTTASGIYGGGATGGVINVILKQHYSGLEASATYGNATRGDASNFRLTASGGINLEDGRTSILASGSYSYAGSPLVGDRDFVDVGRALILRSNPTGATGILNNATPPLGLTTNIRSTTVVAGVTQNLTLKSTGQSLNSPITFVPVGYSGSSSDGGLAFLANAGQYNLHMANTAQSGGGGTATLLNEPTTVSFMTTVRRSMTSYLDMFIEFGVSSVRGQFVTDQIGGTFNIPSTAPNNPFNQNIRVTTPTLGADLKAVSTNDNYRVVTGAILKLPGDWGAELDYSWNRVRLSSSTPGPITAAGTSAVGNGSLNVLRDTNVFPADFSPFEGLASTISPTNSTLQDVTLHAAGPLWQLPAGPISLSGLFEFRDDYLGNQIQANSISQTLNPSRDQRVISQYAELRVPIFGEANRSTGLYDLELLLAARHDNYTTEGVNNVTVGSTTPIVRTTNDLDSIDPTLGIKYAPTEDIALRASYGTGFLPPAVNQLSSPTSRTIPASTAALLGLTDPLRGNTPLGAFTLTSGGNPDLRPERSASWSAGAIVTPRWIPNFRLSIDWTRISKTDNIVLLLVNEDTINDESFVPGVVTRGPLPPGDPFAVGPITGIDVRLANAQRGLFENLDLQLDYSWTSDQLGTFNFSGVATRQIHSQVLLGTSIQENTGQIFNLRWKSNLSVGWEQGPWSASWTVRYFDGYWLNLAHSIVVNQGSAKVPDQIYNDLYVAYAIDDQTRIQLSAQNILDEKPPVDTVNSPAATGTLYSTLADPRLATYLITINRQF